MPAVPILRQIAARRLTEQFQPGDTIILVCTYGARRGYINALQHRPGKGYHIITPMIAAALDWPVRQGYLQDVRPYELVVSLAKTIPTLEEIQYLCP